MATPSSTDIYDDLETVKSLLESSNCTQECVVETTIAQGSTSSGVYARQVEDEAAVSSLDQPIVSLDANGDVIDGARAMKHDSALVDQFSALFNLEDFKGRSTPSLKRCVHCVEDTPHVLKKRHGKLMAEIKNECYLPEHLVIEILSWLPVKALLRFKSVSKAWYSIIKSPYFISKHLRNSNDKNNSPNNRLLANNWVPINALKVIGFLVDKFCRVSAYGRLRGIPLRNSFICGPCDGLYYIWAQRGCIRALWNPATREFQALPPITSKPNLPSDRTFGLSETYGFAMDPIAKDYKVIVLKVYAVIHPAPLSVFIYSLRTNSWRYWGDLAKYYVLPSTSCSSYAFVNTCYYWLGYEKMGVEDSQVIISFDLAAEACKEIQVPNYSQPGHTNLGVYHGLIAFYVVHAIEKYFDIWTLDNEGFWTKKFTLESLPRAYYPIGHWKDNKIILKTECNSSQNQQLLLCDPSVPEVKALAFPRNTTYNCHGVIAYMESLISIKDRMGVS